MLRDPSRVGRIRSWMTPTPSYLLFGAVVLVCTGSPSLDALAQEPTSPVRESVKAPVVKRIQVDGDLNDWPAAMPRYTHRKLFPYGESSWEGPDFSTSPDLSASFMAGYEPEEQILYLAVIVRDDKLIVGNTSDLDTDSVEVFVDGLRSDRRIARPPGDSNWHENIGLSELPVQQYIAIPGEGKVYGMGYGTNPILISGDLKTSQTRMAYRRRGDVTTYEWAIRVFDQYPDKPTRLEPGKRIGFDLAISDRDVPAMVPDAQALLQEPEENRRTWLYWNPTWDGMKVLNASSLGELVLGR
jgi:hypothetical protein